jgi:hypothetical protein
MNIIDFLFFLRITKVICSKMGNNMHLQWLITRESHEIVTHVILESEKKALISWHILHQHWYPCPTALSVHQKPQHKSLLTVVSATTTPPFQPLCHQRNICHPVVNCFTRQTLPPVYRNHFFLIPFALSPSAHKKCIKACCSSVE